MLLAISAGNSNIHLGVARDGHLVASRRAATDPRATPDDIEVMLLALLSLEGLDLARVRAISLASSVPAVAAAVELVAGRRGIPCLVAGAGTLPLPVRVDRPGDVGPDRLVNAYAAARLHGAPVVVVDCGTATTVDAVDASGAFVGGAIAPGMLMGMEALAAGTARLPRVDARPQEAAIGRDTMSAIRAGTVLGHRILVEGLVARARAELAATAGWKPRANRIPAVLTGGLAALPWARTVEGIDVVDPDLTLRGLIAFHLSVAGEPEPAGGDDAPGEPAPGGGDGVSDGPTAIGTPA